MISTTISSIEDLFVFKDDISHDRKRWGIKASLKWDESKYVIANRSDKHAAIAALMQLYFKDIIDYIQADVMPKPHRCKQCGYEILYVDPGYSDDGNYVCIECK